MRNIVILKDLPSNIVEEAFIVFKENQKIKNPQYAENFSEKFSEKNDRNNEDEFVIREAELLVSNYIDKIENQESVNFKPDGLLEKKYKKLKIFSTILLIFSVVSFLYIIK